MYYSFDGGAQWLGNEDVSGPGAADPMVAFDPDGIAYLLYQKSALSDIYLRISNDGGINWGDEIQVVHKNPTKPDYEKVDRPWLCISPVRNNGSHFNIYVATTVIDNTIFGYPEKRIIVRISHNGGYSFSSFTSFNSEEDHFTEGPSIAIGTHETNPELEKVCFAWASVNKSTNIPDMEIEVRLWDVNKNNNSYADISSYSEPTKRVGQWNEVNHGFMIKNHLIKADSYPRIAFDNSINPNSKGKIFITWAADMRFQQASYSDIYVLKGQRNANSVWEWSVANNGWRLKPGPQWMPAINITPDGVLGIFYYSSQSESYNEPISAILRKSYDGGTIWENGLSLNSPGFTIPYNEPTFLGDYHGVTGWYRRNSQLPGKGYGLWCEYDENDNQTKIFFGSQDYDQSLPSEFYLVKCDQQDIEENSFETLGRWNEGSFSYYKVPYDFIFHNATTEVLKAKQGFKEGSSQKYHDWNNNESIINFEHFDIENDQEPITGFFDVAYNATIKTVLITMGGMDDKVRLRFKDPWYFESGDPNSPYYDPPYGYQNLGMVEARFKIHDSPFNPNTNPSGSGSEYKGVFLNQPYTGNNPYYSVCVPQDTIISFHNDDIT